VVEVGEVEHRPDPRPGSTCPPLIRSLCATAIAGGPGSRDVAADTSAPDRMRLVSRAGPARVTHASVGPGRR
jgi:hypothetical protein